jgi:hypothetical protein
MALVVVGYGPIALAQDADPHKEHHTQAAKPSEGDRATKQMGQGMMARMAALDARIDTLVADVNMFSGELKITAMTSLLAALAERNTAMREMMMQMREQMMRQMMEAKGPAASSDEESGMMCGSMMKPDAAAPHP